MAIKKKIIKQPRIIPISPQAKIRNEDGMIFVYPMNDISISSKSFAVVGSGCRVELPKNCIGLIRSNSKLFITKNVYIHPAKDTIFPSDSHDCELFILLQNDGESNVNISILEPIAIIKFLEYNNIDVIIKKMNNKKKVSK